MIPFFAIVHIDTHDGHRIRLWLPLFLVWLLLVVLGLLLSPIIIIACLIVRLNPFRVVWELIGVLIAMAGVHIEVRSPEAVIYVRVI